MTPESALPGKIEQNLVKDPCNKTYCDGNWYEMKKGFFKWWSMNNNR